jgi:hypothetical protein
MKKEKVYLIQIWYANQVLNKISTSDMSIAAGFNVLKLKETISREFALVEQQRVALLKKYGAGDGVPLPEEFINEFTSKFNDFLVSNQTEIYVNKIKLSAIINENIRLTPDELATAGFIIDNDIDQAEPEEEPETPVDEVTPEVVDDEGRSPAIKSKTKIKANLTVVNTDDVKDQVLLE